MGDEENIPDQKNTIGAMLIQIAILFGFAALSYLDSIATIDPFANAGSSAIAAFFLYLVERVFGWQVNTLLAT